MKKVLIISTSLRANSNSESLADAFARGAKEAGNDVELISLRKMDIQFCKGCLACTRTHKCTIKDDAAYIIQQMHDADVIAFATPIYYYEMSGQMKTLLDRSNPLYYTDYHFRDIYLLSSATEDEQTTPEGAIHGLNGWIACYENARLAGSIFAGGVTDPGEILNPTPHAAIQEAYQLGHSIH